MRRSCRGANGKTLLVFPRSWRRFRLHSGGRRIGTDQEHPGRKTLKGAHDERGRESAALTYGTPLGDENIRQALEYAAANLDDRVVELRAVP